MKTVPKPYEHQLRALDFIKDLNFFALFMQQGTGKSKVTLMLCENKYSQNKIDSCLLISPNSLKEQWVKEQVETHFSIDSHSHVWNGMTTQDEKRRFKKFLFSKSVFRFLSVNVEAFQSSKIDPYIKDFLIHSKPLLIIDESTRIKNPKALRTTKIQSFFSAVPYKGILSGTPTPNGPFDLYSQFDFLKKDFWKMSYHQYQHRYGIMLSATNKQTGKHYNRPLDEITFNRVKSLLKKETRLDSLGLDKIGALTGVAPHNVLYIKKMEKYSAFKNLEEIDAKIAPFTFKITKEECVDLPPKVFKTLVCELSAEQKRVYKELSTNCVSSYKGKEMVLQEKIVLALRLQQVTGGFFPFIKNFDDNDEEIEFGTKPFKEQPKLSVLIDDLQDLDPKESVLIWARFTNEIELLTKELAEKGFSVASYYGKTPKAKRPEIVEDFKNKKIQILVLNPAVGGEGLNLQVSTLHYFYSNGYKADHREQAEDRSHRIGQGKTVVYKDIVAKGTFDEKILKILKSKKSVIDYFRKNNLKEILD